MKQQTIKSSFTLKGKGLHTGLDITARFLPSEEGSGIRICRRDLPNFPTFEALADYVSATERGTVLENGNWKVSTVEHMLSAFYALGIDNCLVEVDGPEIPILDGSAQPFIDEINKVGIKEQRAEARELVINETIEYTSEDGNKMVISPCDHLEVEVTISYNSTLLRKQTATLTDVRDYPTEIAPARTFCFVREIEPLLQRGLIKGGDLKNSLVIYETPMTQQGIDLICKKLGQEKVDASKLGYLSPLNYHNEPARHKLLDVLGDISLIGCRLCAKISVFKPGHTFNTQCAKRLKNKLIRDVSRTVHPTAFVHPEAKIAESVSIGPYSYIDKGVTIGENTIIEPHVTIHTGTTIGKNCHIFPGAVIGGIPQDLKFQGEETTVEIGDYTTIREYVTVHRGTASKFKTVIGSHCLIMAYCHVAHDCCLHDHIIMSNLVQLAGEVVIDDWAVIGGGTLMHQFTHVGKHVMVQGGSKVNKDIPPYTIAAREPISFCGINSIGLRRRGFTNEQINSIQDVYRCIYASGLNVSQAMEKVLSELPNSAEKDEIVLFIENSSRGICRKER